MDKNRENIANSKLLTADFGSKPKKETKKTENFSHVHSNPVQEKLLKLTHIKLSKHVDDYRSFSDFKPEDLI